MRVSPRLGDQPAAHAFGADRDDGSEVEVPKHRVSLEIGPDSWLALVESIARGLETQPVGRLGQIDDVRVPRVFRSQVEDCSRMRVFAPGVRRGTEPQPHRAAPASDHQVDHSQDLEVGRHREPSLISDAIVVVPVASIARVTRQREFPGLTLAWRLE